MMVDIFSPALFHISRWLADGLLFRQPHYTFIEIAFHLLPFLRHAATNIQAASFR